MSLNSGNRFCMYFVDLFAVSLVSWICMIVVLFRELFIRLCRFGSVVLSDESFQVIMFLSWLVLLLVFGTGVGVTSSGGGCEYPFMFSRQRSDSIINWFGRKGNLLWRVVGVGVISWLWIDSYNFLYIEFLGVYYVLVILCK